MKREIAFVVVLFLVAIAVVNPRGNMPLDDDWDFAITTWRLASTGHFAVTPFTAVSLLLQALWGAAWTKLFGASFEVLRASTLVLACAALAAFVALLHCAGVPRGARLLATLALAFHPIFFWSSATFMTHVPFAFFAIVALAAHCRALRDDDARWMIAGALAVVASFLIRQTGIVNALPPLVVLLLRREGLTPRWRTFAMIAASPLVVFAVAAPLLIHRETLGHAGLPGNAEQIVCDNLAYGALFALPLIVASKPRRNAAFWLVLAAVGIRFLLAAWPPPWRPWSLFLSSDASSGNVLVNLGLGPWTTMDIRELAMLPPVTAITPLRLAVTLLAVLAAALAAGLIGEVAKTRNLAGSLAAVHLVAATGVLGLSGMYFDRYALDSTWSLLLLGATVTLTNRRAAMVALVVVALFSIAGLHDYFAWNRARFDAWQSLRRDGVAVEAINAGYELNAWGRLEGRPVPLTRPEWIVRNDYVIAFHHLPGYEVVHTVPYRQLFGGGGFVFAERRTGAARFVPPTSLWR